MTDHKKYGSAPIEKGRMIFTSPDAQKEWDELTESQKKFVMKNLSSMADKMEAKIAIEMLCQVINDLAERIERLENAVN